MSPRKETYEVTFTSKKGMRSSAPAPDAEQQYGDLRIRTAAGKKGAMYIIKAEQHCGTKKKPPSKKKSHK